jgi:hypothetical protein
MKTFRIKMRNILFLYIILFSGFAYAQDYMPLPDSNATWIVRSGSSEIQFIKKIYIPGVNYDTLINGLPYVKLMVMSAVFYPPFTPWPASSSTYGPDYFGAYRSVDSGYAYIKFPEGYLGLGDEEILLMDLTVELRDTIKQLPTSFLGFDYIYSDFLVDSIDYVLNGPYTRKRIMLRNLDPQWGMECRFHWVEGLGNVSSGFQNVVGCGFENVGLTCISINDSIFFGDWEWVPIPGNCYYPYVTAVIQEEIMIPLLVYPSPASEYVIFELNANDRNGTVTITDLTGRPVASFQLTGEKTVWQTEGVKPGVYLYRLQTPEGSAGGKLLIAP